MAGTGSASTVVSIEMHLRRLRKNMREPPVSNNLSSRSEDFFFSTSVQLDAQFRSTQCDVALVRSRAACKPRQADTFGRLNRKTNVLCLHRSVGQSKSVSFSRRFFDGPPTSPNECQVFRDIWWKPKPDHCPMLSARPLFWASCSLDMCPLMRFARPLPFLARSCRLSFASWGRRLPKPFFSCRSAKHRMKFQRNVFGSLDVVHREDGDVCHQWANGARQVFGISKRAPFWCSSLHHGECKPNGRQRTSTGSCLQVQTIVGCGRFLTH